MPGGLARRAWIVVLVATLIGATSAATLDHGGHGFDQDCALCTLRHQPVAELAAGPQPPTTYTPRLVVSSPGNTPTLAYSDPAVPARAPPV